MKQFWIVLAVVFLGMSAMPSFPESAVTVDDVFSSKNIQGAFLLENKDKSRIIIHNEKRLSEEFLPASTFKILNALVALEEGVVASTDERIPWDGQEKGLVAWNRDHNLSTAFRSSCVWFFQELAKRIGCQTYVRHLLSCDYGNKRTGPRETTFWLDGDLRISPREQGVFLRKLQGRTLPYSRRSIDAVRDLMLVEEGSGYRLYAKTGWALRVSPQIGWYVGFVETSRDVWFFVCNTDIRSAEDARFREEGSREILRRAGVLP